MSERRRTGIRHTALFWFGILFMSLCFSGAVLWGCRQVTEKNVVFLDEDTSYTAKEAMEIQKQTGLSEDKSLSFTFWGEERGKTVENRALNRRETATLVTVCGDSGLVLPGSTELNMVPGCLLDEEMCLRLFGSTQVVGARIQIGEGEYAVRGILYNTEGTVLVQADGSEEAALDRISVNIPKGISAKEVVRKLSTRLGLSDQSVAAASSQSYGALGVFAACLLPAILYLSLSFSAVRWSLKAEKGTVERWLGMAFGGLAFISFLWTTGIQPAIPKEWIPTRWSDFGFFAELWKNAIEGAVRSLIRVKEQPMLIYIWNSMKALAFGTVAAVCCVFISFQTKRMEIWPAFLCNLLYLCFVFTLLTVFCGRYGLSERGIRILWLAIPVYLWEKYLFDQCKRAFISME